MSPELLKAIHMADTQETAIIETMMGCPDEVWDFVWGLAVKMAGEREYPAIQTLGMLALYGWNQARVKVAQRVEDAVG